MPSNRAILADITELGLDPAKAHTKMSSTGHLSRPNSEHSSSGVTVQSVEHIEQNESEIQAPESPVTEDIKNALVEIETTNLPKKKKKFEKKETSSDI